MGYSALTRVFWHIRSVEREGGGVQRGITDLIVLPCNLNLSGQVVLYRSAVFFVKSLFHKLVCQRRFACGKRNWAEFRWYLVSGVCTHLMSQAGMDERVLTIRGVLCSVFCVL